MGNIFSNPDTIIEAERNIKEAAKVLGEIAEVVAVRVAEDVAVKEIETKLESIEEHHKSATHYSNLKHDKIKFKNSIEKKEIEQYPQSHLTTYKKLKQRSFFSFYR